MEPPVDSRYAKPSFEQLRTADKLIFRELQQACRAGIQPTRTGSFPLEANLKIILDSPKVAMVRIPLPRVGGGKRHREDEDVGNSEDKNKKSRRQRQKEAEERKRKAAADAGRGADHGKGDKGGGKGGKGGKGDKGAGRGAPRVPRQLLGLDGCRPDGKRRCYGFNLKECTAVAPGQECARGFHECMKCGGNHAALDCTS